MIAPYATPLDLANSGRSNRVYYESGGSSPNRYFVVEFYRVVRNDETYTFEVILYENGDIVFQYQAMTYKGGFSCGAAGIEDSVGLDGLAYLGFCAQAPSDRAVRFYHPAPSARVGIQPLYQGRFTQAMETVAFQVLVRNTGELGSDTYDLSVSSPWTANLYAADGTTALTDTDGDGTVDTGSVAQGGNATVVVKVATPGTVNVGDDNSATVTVRSSLDTSKSKTVSLQTAVPAPFAQVFRDDDDGAMSLYLAQPSAQIVNRVTEDWHYGYDMAVAEMPDSFAYVWTHYRSVDSAYVGEIEYTLLDSSGNTTRAVSKLADHSGATTDTYDYYPAVAVAPNGRIGVLWYRLLSNSSTSQYNYNVYFAILNSSGNLVYGPVNLTNNDAWGTWSDYDAPYFYSPRIAGTDDNRFVLAWHREHQESEGWVEDIYYAVRDTGGGEVRGITRLTDDTPGWDDGHNGVNLTSVAGNRALLTWFRSGSGIYHAVLDSTGNVVKAPTNLGSDGGGTWYGSTDVVQLANGRIVVAWVNDDQIRFAVLDSAYDLVSGFTTLSNPAAATGDRYVSIAPARNQAVLTWMDSHWSSRRNLYYALVDSNGNVITDPMIFRTSQAASPYILTSYDGYGNTSYSLDTPTTDDVDARVTVPAIAGGAPGGTAAVPASASNYGLTAATSVVLTATLDSDLGYAGASPAPSTASGITVVWNLSDMDFLGEGRVVLYTTVPSTTIGARYPVIWTLTSDGPEANRSDNTATTDVMVALQVFLPLVTRNY